MLPESKSDDCLRFNQRGGRMLWSRNAELRKQRSTSMDAIMFLELLENEIKDMPECSSSSSSGMGIDASARDCKLDDKFKKSRISKGSFTSSKMIIFINALI